MAPSRASIASSTWSRRIHEAALADLRRGMAVADVPGQPRELGALGRDLGQRLGRRPHRDQPAVHGLEGVALGERDRLGQIDLQRRAAVGGQQPPPEEAALVVERHAVRRGVGGGPGEPAWARWRDIGAHSRQPVRPRKGPGAAAQ